MLKQQNLYMYSDKKLTAWLLMVDYNGLTYQTLVYVVLILIGNIQKSVSGLANEHAAKVVQLWSEKKISCPAMALLLSTCTR